MNYDITFRFVTRTLSEDYRVFTDDGKKILDDLDEFAPLREAGNIISENGTCAVIFQEAGKFLLVV